ncbi:MAG: carbohydrate ABC transporter substrate-binding protein, partial [Cellulomonadaceae bacterium]|nr:carbohydrate ABC transporter substrate-binding protein [Cellulomonadaceae bacterium]
MRSERAGRRAQRARVVLTGAIVATLALTGCTPDPVATDNRSVEVFSWWASGSEKLALDALVAVFHEQHPGIEFINGAIAGGAGSAAKDVLASRMTNGDPPDTFLIHGGVEIDEHVEAGDLQDLDALFDELHLTANLPDAVLDAVSVDGTVYAVPADVHRANLLWANPTVLAASGLDPAADYDTLDQWFVALEAIKATGRTPLAVGSTWTQVHLLEQVLLSRLGADGYSGLWDGSTDPASPEVTAAIDDFGRLLTYTNADRDALDWQDAAQRVVDGQAAFTVMGDWAVASFETGGLGPATWWPVPGTVGVYDMVLDAFTLPVGSRRPEEASDWLRTVASHEGQVAFANAKGAIPARDDVSTAELGTYQRAALAGFRSDEVVLSFTHGSAAGSAAVATVSAAVATFTAGTTGTPELQA